MGAGINTLHLKKVIRVIKGWYGVIKGALWNQYGGYHIVTNSMAHVWVEAYVNGEWVRKITSKKKRRLAKAKPL